MTNFIIRRLIQTLLVVICLSFVTYCLMGLMPGDPLDIACQANPLCTSENLEEMKKTLGLDRPIYERYWNWFSAMIFEGDLGYSRTYRLPVGEILFPRLVNTFILNILVLVVCILIAIPIGVLTALKANSKFDYGINLAAFAGISTPSFWLALMLILIFSVTFPIFPAGGTFTVGLDESQGFFATILDRGKHLVLPVISLSLLTIASWVRFTRASMLGTMRMDFIRTARSKGIKNSQVVIRHGLRNALIPVVTIIALSFSTIFSGSVITETVFAYQGVGKLIFDSIMASDFNVAMVGFLISTFAVLIMNLIADILYAYIDPRISYK